MPLRFRASSNAKKNRQYYAPINYFASFILQAPVMTSSMTAASPSDAANAATNYSPMILEYKNDIELMNQERLRKLARDAFCEVLNLSDEQIENYDLLEHIYINEPDEGEKKFLSLNF